MPEKPTRMAGQLKKTRLFMGEMMTCKRCGRTKKSSSLSQSDWTAVEDLDSGAVDYFCPTCFNKLLKGEKG